MNNIIQEERLRRIKYDIVRMVDIFVDELQTKDPTITAAETNFASIKSVLKNIDILGEDFVIDQGYRAEIAMKRFLRYKPEYIPYT